MAEYFDEDPNWTPENQSSSQLESKRLIEDLDSIYKEDVNKIRQKYLKLLENVRGNNAKTIIKKDQQYELDKLSIAYRKLRESLQKNSLDSAFKHMYYLTRRQEQAERRAWLASRLTEMELDDDREVAMKLREIFDELVLKDPVLAKLVFANEVEVLRNKYESVFDKKDTNQRTSESLAKMQKEFTGQLDRLKKKYRQ